MLSITDIVPDLTAEAWATTWAKVKTLGSITFETRHKTKLGQIFPVEVSASYVEFGGKEFSFRFARDITQRKQIEKELGESENYVTALLATMPAGVVVIDSETQRVTDANSFALTLMGRERGQVVADLTIDPPTGEDHDAVRDRKAELMKAIRPLTPDAVVRGQYEGYRSVPGVRPGSNVETFVAIRLYIDSWRWAGVPIYIRAGKRMPVTCTEAMVRIQASTARDVRRDGADQLGAHAHSGQSGPCDWSWTAHQESRGAHGGARQGTGSAQPGSGRYAALRKDAGRRDPWRQRTVLAAGSCRGAVAHCGTGIGKCNALLYVFAGNVGTGRGGPADGKRRTME